MANVINTILRNIAVRPVKYAIKQENLFFPLQLSARTLYSEASLGVDAYIQQRERTKAQLSKIGDKFREKMKEYTGSDSKNMIFTEDLKNMIHMAEEEDVELVVNMMKRFNTQNKELRFGNFIFGPVVFRMLYYWKKPDVALECFNSPDLEGFFDQLITYQILMDMLFINKQYNDVLKTFEKITEKQMDGVKYPRNIVVLTLAACYKLNTPESLTFAFKLWSQLTEIGHMPMRRATTFCAALALNQGNPEAALEILSGSKNQNYTTIRNLKAAALAKIGRVDHIIPLLKGILAEDVPINTKHTFNDEVLQKCQKVIDEKGSLEEKEEFKRLYEYFKQNGHISDATLDEQLCSEITTPAFMPNNRREISGFRLDSRRFEQEPHRFDQNTRENRAQDRRFNNYRRPGLSELQ